MKRNTRSVDYNTLTSNAVFAKISRHENVVRRIL